MTKGGSIPATPRSQPDANAPSVVRLERLLPELLAAGVLTAREAVTGVVRLVPVGRSHPVFRLEVDGAPRAAVKLFEPPRGDTDGRADRERAVQALALRVPELAALAPPALPHAGPGWLVVSRWVDAAPAWEGDALTGARGGTAALDLAALAPAVMPRLAAMHRATARLAHAGALPAAFDGPLPWALRLFDGDGPAELWRHPMLAAVLADAGRRPALVAGVRRARGAWRPVALVHGDLKHDNLLVGPAGATVIDWEMARVGDPAWDLAGLMLRPLLDPAADGGWTDATVAAAGALLLNYCAAARLPPPPLAQRLLLFAGAWLLMCTVQYRSTAAAPDEAGTGRMLRAAEACFTGCDAIAARLVGAARAA